MVSQLEVGIVLTILAWLGLQAAVIHGKHVVEKIETGDYRKGPYRHKEGGTNE